MHSRKRINIESKANNLQMTLFFSIERNEDTVLAIKRHKCNNHGGNHKHQECPYLLRKLLDIPERQDRFDKCEMTIRYRNCSSSVSGQMIEAMLGTLRTLLDTIRQTDRGHVGHNNNTFGHHKVDCTVNNKSRDGDYFSLGK